MANLRLLCLFHFGADEATVKTAVHEKVDALLDGKNVVKEIYVRDKIYNIVVK